MTRLLITGSRDATPAMLDYAHRLVMYARDKGWHIIVGDAEGIDAQVIHDCSHASVAFNVFGITTFPRNGGLAARLHYIQVNEQSFLGRDRHMVRMCSRCMAIWNGRSRGTKYTYDYAVAQGKKAEMRQFSSPDIHIPYYATPTTS